MSVTFSTSNSGPSSAGYFRIGFVTLQIPPQNIVTSRVVNNDKLATLRGMNEMFRKTGQARWDVTVSWAAMMGGATPEAKYQQWNDLQNVAAMFKAAPFVEVESPHLRQVLAPHDPLMAYPHRLGMALRQLRVDSHPDIVDTLLVTLTMTYFNFGPYSVAFDYVGDEGQPVSADQCTKFKNYIAMWRANNMDHVSARDGDPIAPLWMAQDPGEMALKYRIYNPVPTGQLPDFGTMVMPGGAQVGTTVLPSTYTPASATSAAAGKASKGTLPPDIEALIRKTALTVKGYCDPAIACAVCLTESAGNPTAHNAGSTAQGLFQLLAGTRQSLNVADGFNAQQSAQGGCQYLADLFKKLGTWELAVAGFNQGSGTIVAYRDGKALTDKSNGHVINPNKLVTGGIPPDPAVQRYVSTILRNAQMKFGFTGQTAPQPGSQRPQTAQVAPAAATNSATSPATSTSNPMTATDSATEQAFQAQATEMAADGWSLDHRSDTAGVGICFFYKEAEVRMAPLDSSTADVTGGIWPTQFSVLLVNNLAQIPLSGYQYPTYQHLGPCSSLVQISFMSKGERADETQEPVHEGLRSLSSMAHFMEQQHLRLRTQLRTPNSLHRMQAVYVENQVLNMLGIYGLMLDQVTTETLPESSDLVTAQLTASQYENRFEEIEPYKLNGISQAYNQGLKDLVLTDNTIQQAPSDVQGPLKPILNYRTQADNADENAMIARLMEVAAQPSSTLFTYMAGAPTFTISQVDAAQITYQTGVDWSKYPVALARVKQLQQTGDAQTWTMADYLMIKSVAWKVYKPVNLGGSIQHVDSTFQGNTRRTMVQDAYQRLFAYFAASDTGLRTALNQVMNSPALAAKVKGAVPSGDPSLASPGSNDHGAYRDMGLNTILLNGEDFNPGMYFVNNNEQYKTLAKGALLDVMRSTASAAAQTNSNDNSQQLPNSVAPISSTTSLTPTNLPVDQAGQINLPAGLKSIPGNADTVMRMCNIPGYNMAEAFPTFKLMFLEDENNNVYYAFDDFFSYASVLDFEMQRPWNRPATLQIKITNLAYLLNHKIYDASTAGKWASYRDRFATEVSGSAAVAVPSDTNTKITAGKEGIGGTPYQLMGPDMTEGPRGGNMKNRRIPLQYFPLQTGTKIQLRVGYSNNPDKLFPIFCGTVTEMEGNEIITITAQSFMLELTEPLSDKAQTDSWIHIGSLLESGLSCLTLGRIGTIGRGAAYGGLTLFGDSGDTGTVISKMLKSSGAKHFGHWQIDATGNHMLKGFGWKELSGEVAGTAAGWVGHGDVGIALQSNYDRTDENVMINSAGNFDGTSTDAANSHQYLDQGSPLRPFSYYVDSATQLTLMELIQDVARRYPEYLLLEKWYGYPYSCDATLVFGHPFDWYFARPSLLGDQEKQRAADQNIDAYKLWWDAQGKKMFTDLLGGAGHLSLLGIPLGSSVGWLESHVMTGLVNQAAQSPAGLQAALQSDAIVGMTPGVVGKIPGLRDFQRALQQDAAAILKSYYASQMSGSDLASSDRMKPVRRYHFIDDQSIVHNGMSLNDKIYNCVKIGDGEKGGKKYAVSANPNIMPSYLRALDVTDRINDPKQNVIDQALIGTNQQMIQVYGQSFLREEVGKMYKGEIILRGIPEIEPMDILMIMDPATGMQGPVEVDTVTQIMNLEMGFITIIKPRAVVCINEASSAGFLRMLGMMAGAALPELRRLTSLSRYAVTGAGTKAVTAAVVGRVGWAGLKWAGEKAASGVVSNALKATSEGLLDVATAPGAITGFTTAVGTASEAAGTAATGALAAEGAMAGTVAFLASPPGWAVLALCAVAAIGGSIWMVNKGTENSNALVISPCLKLGRPWVGGVQGWAIEDMVGIMNNEAMQFMADEIFPLYDLWLEAGGYSNPIPAAFQPALAQ